jgi:hypothetical protein
VEKEQLKGRLKEYLDAKGISGDRGKYRCLAGTHQDDHPSMSLHKSGEFLHCFSCNGTLDIFGAAAALMGVPCDKNHFPEICRDIEKTLGIPSEKWKPGKDFYNRNRDLAGKQIAPLSKSAAFRDALLAEFGAAVDGGNMELAYGKAAMLFALYLLPDGEPGGGRKKENAAGRELERMYEKIRQEGV